MGCRGCIYHYSEHGDAKCQFSPHDFKTPMQRVIVLWLATPNRVAMTDDGCAGFRRFRPVADRGPRECPSEYGVFCPGCERCDPS